MNWRAPANSSLPSWQCEDNAGQKYLCGWRKVNFSASLFFPGNRGHRQIEQNRSRHRVRRGPVGRQREPCPPLHTYSCLLPSGSLSGGAVAGVVGRAKGLESWHPTRPGLDGLSSIIWLKPAMVPLGKMTPEGRKHLPKVTQPVRSQNSPGPA